MADRWLEALMKAAPEPARVETNSDPLFAAIFDRPGDEPGRSIGATEMSKVFDDGNTDTIPKTVFDYFALDQATPAPLAKRAAPVEGAPLQLFMRLSKVDEEKRLVYGVATSEQPDREDEVCDYEGSKPYFQKWSESVQKDSQGKSKGNLREMHTLSACGTVDQIQFNDAAKQIEICAKVVDDNAWRKVKTGTYSGFSVGGRYAKTWQVGKLTHYIADPVEVSLVDRPAVPNATFQMVKAGGAVEVCKFAIEQKGEAMKDAEHVKGIYEHLKANHEAASAHHNALATAHTNMVGAHDEKSDEYKFHKTAADTHMEARDAHDAAAEKCSKAIADCEKAARDQMNKAAEDVPASVLENAVRETFIKMFGNSLVPTGVSAIAPSRPIIRPGQPQLPAAPNVDRQFQKLFETADDNMEKTHL